MPFIGLLTTDNSIPLQFENTIFNAKAYVQLLKDDIYFFHKIQKSKKLQLQYFINVYFWTFKWLNQNQSDFINDIVTTNEELVSKCTEDLNAFYISIFKNKPYIKVSNLNVAANQFFTNRPSFLIFNWVTILGGLYYSGGIVTSGISNWKLYKKPVLDFLTKNVWQSVLWEPIIKILKTLNDYDSKDLSIVASDYTLSNEKTSLKEQYQTFLANNHTQKINQEKNYNDDELEKNFLHLYNEITNKPWSSLVKGDLITVLLITLQRVKLEANVSLSSIDKLIQSQNLLIKIIGITPAILILYSTYKFVIKPIIYDAPLSIFSNLINFIKGQVYILNNSNKNINLEYKLLYCKLINNDKTDVAGNYFVSLDDLYELGLKHIPTKLHLCWNEQIKRLLNTNDSKDHMIEIMTLDSAYSIYFTQ